MSTYQFNNTSYTKEGIENLIDNTSADIRLLSDALLSETSSKECDRILEVIKNKANDLSMLHDLIYK